MKTSSCFQTRTLALLFLCAAPLFGSESAVTTERSAQLVSTITPTYPYLMRRSEATAEVTVSFTVNSKGLVTKAAVLDSNNFEFNAATLDAIKKWTFTPATRNGQAVETKLQQRFTFSVRDGFKVSSMPLVAAGKNAR